METRCCHKKLEFQTAIRFLYRSLWAHFTLFFKPKREKKKKSWADIGPRSAWEKLSQLLIRSGEIPSPRQTSTKTTTAPWNLNGAHSLGAPTHPLVTVFIKRPVIRGGRRAGVWYKHIWALCRKQATKFLDPSPMAKNRPFFRFGRKKRRTPWATSRPLDHGSTWYLGGRLLHSPALPDTNRVGRGLVLCRDRRPVVAWAIFDQRVDNSKWKDRFRRVQQLEQIILLIQKKNKHFFPCFPHMIGGGTSVASAGFFSGYFGKETCNITFPLSSI